MNLVSLRMSPTGLLAGRRATSFPGALDGATGHLFSPDPVVVDRPLVTSRGPGTAMDFALELIRLLGGPEVHDRVEAGLQRS